MSEGHTSSAFDRFIHAFAAKNLERRVKIVSLVSVLLMLGTICACVFFLNLNFEVVETGKLVLEFDNTATLVLKAKFAKFIGSDMSLFLKDKNNQYQKTPCNIIEQSEAQNTVLVKLVLTGPAVGLTSTREYDYRLVFENRRYWDLLLDKSEDLF